jgi:aminoglycoside phosphotransferase (APT) family kinase protein
VTVSGETPHSELTFHLKDQSEALDRTRAGLESWLRTTLDDPGASMGALAVPQGTGVANETVMFDLLRTTGPTVGTTEGYVARLATSDPLYLDYDLSMHYRMYESMMAFPSVPTPAVLGYEADATVIGAPFFVMERIDGLIPADAPSWAAEGFVVDATPHQRHDLWEATVRMMAELHLADDGSFGFLRTHATESGTGDCLDFWRRSMQWAQPDPPIPLAQECEEWLLANLPKATALSWGDSRLPNVIYRDLSPVGLLDWDLVSLAGPEADLAWWIVMAPPEAQALDGIGSHDEMLDIWSDVASRKPADLRWYLVLGAYRLAAIFAKLFAMMVAQGHMDDETARGMLATGQHVQLMSGLLDLTPPPGVVPIVPDVRL